MKTREHIIQQLAEALPGLRDRYGVRTLALFGSVARGEDDATSDVDIMVEFEHPPRLAAFLDLEAELARLLDAQVDLVMRTALKPRVSARALAEEIAV